MRKNAFTLIELLAVIVILAIIALIAVPIVLNIIKSSTESSYKSSIKNYGKSVENAVADYKMLNPTSDLAGNYVSSNNGKMLTLGTTVLKVDYDGNNIECDVVKIYLDGSIYVGQCQVDGKDVPYEYGEEIKLYLIKKGVYNENLKFFRHFTGTNTTIRAMDGYLKMHTYGGFDTNSCFRTEEMVNLGKKYTKVSAEIEVRQFVTWARPIIYLLATTESNELGSAPVLKKLELNYSNTQPIMNQKIILSEDIDEISDSYICSPYVVTNGAGQYDIYIYNVWLS